jgi:uncharacterized protein YbjQ (UPF0145 family)
VSIINDRTNSSFAEDEANRHEPLNSFGSFEPAAPKKIGTTYAPTSIAGRSPVGVKSESTTPSGRQKGASTVTDNQPHYGETGGSQFPITTALVFPDVQIQRSLGMVFGVVVRSMGMAKGITAGFKALAGGEVKQYTRLVEDSRRHAMDRMIENAQLLGAQGIVSMRFDSSEVGQSLTEIVAYGTAVTFSSQS